MKKKLIAKYDLIDCKDDFDCDIEWENFKGNLEYYFNKYLGYKVIVKAKNVTWKNLSGYKSFDLDNVINIFEKVKPDASQLNFYLWQTGINSFQAKCGHHDGLEKYYYKIKQKGIKEVE
jgi:hypothetical protein|tara:strand:+ start:735 stop:1091 length:357 start_codon:yes stop_codon:yes gene_type:complete